MPKLDRAEFDRRLRCHHEDPTSDFANESWKGLEVYEKFLQRRKVHKNIRAIRSWTSIRDKGLIKSTQDRVTKDSRAGFRLLIAEGRRECTDEHVVIKYH